MKTNVAKERITELGAAEKLYQLRSEQEHFIGDSFDPIIAYGKHAAIVHYSATEETDFPSETVRPFMHIQKISYPMSGTMIIIFAKFPKRTSGKVIKV